MSDRLVRTSLTLGAVLCAGVAVHVASVLILPRLAPRDAFARAAAQWPASDVRLLPPASSDAAPLRGGDPLVASALCRFDLARGPLRVVAPVAGGAFTALSFYTRWGTAFYGLTDRAENEGKLSVSLMTPGQLAAAQAEDGDEGAAREVRVSAPTSEGFVKLDVLPRVGGPATVAALLHSMRCEVQGKS